MDGVLILVSATALLTGWMRRSRWSRIFIILGGVIAFWLISELCMSQRHVGPTAIVRCNGYSIVKADLAEAMRALLWRRGEDWGNLSAQTREERREEALTKLIDNRLAEDFVSKAPAVAPSSDSAMNQFLKQFESDDAIKERIKLQGCSEATLQRRISGESAHLGALEAWLLTQQSQPPAAAARAWFEAHISDLAIPERIHASHIFLTSHDRQKPDREAEIRELHRKLMAHEATLEEVAKKLSEDEGSSKRGGDLGWFTRNRVPADFADAVFALPPGQISTPFRSRLGWHIVMVHELKPERAPSFEEVKDEITAKLQTEQRQAAFKKLMEELRGAANIQRFDAQISRVDPAP